MEDSNEQQLSMAMFEESLDTNSDSTIQEEDFGPSKQQIADQVSNQAEVIEPCYGTVNKFNCTRPKHKHKTMIDAMKSAERQGRLITI
jgi:hypothetical protein